jgi:hypothetical protein
MNKSILRVFKEKNKRISQTENLFREEIIETDKSIKYLLNSAIFLGAFGFLIVGISSYLKFNLLPFLNASQIIFFPQGLTMCFYGSLGLILSINQFAISILNIGEGFNEFDKTKGNMKIYRKGFPGKNSDVDIIYPLKDIVRKTSMFFNAKILSRKNSRKLSLY